jgi:hypothetical protein
MPMRRFLLALSLLVTVQFLAAASDKDARSRVALGIPYEDAVKQLDAVSIPKGGELQIESSDTDVALEFFELGRDAVLVIGRSTTTKLVKSLTIYYIPDNRTSRGQVVAMAVRSIEFRTDKSYVVHFEPSAPKAK